MATVHRTQPLVRTALAQAEHSRTFVPGIYRHYRNGKTYRAIVCGLHTETLEQMVVYTSLDLSNPMPFLRPLSMFLEHVTHGGVIEPRFQLLAPLDPKLPYYPYMTKE